MTLNDAKCLLMSQHLLKAVKSFYGYEESTVSCLQLVICARISGFQVVSKRRMSEKLCLQWNDFQDNVNTAFGKLKGDNEFSDVTLACEDGQQFEAHKVILVSSSPFFHNLLRKNKHTHPVIYMRGTKSKDMSAILDFLYYGEANIFQENLDPFLALAEELKLKGLMGREEELQESCARSQSEQRRVKTPRQEPEPLNDFNNMSTDKQFLIADSNTEQKVAISQQDLQELDAQVKSMMDQGQKMIQSGKQQRRSKICKICGKEGVRMAIVDHIEAHHLEGVSLPCNVCEKTFRSRTSLRLHKCRNVLNM